MGGNTLFLLKRIKKITVHIYIERGAPTYIKHCKYLKSIDVTLV